MAVASPAATLPAVAEELLKEMAAAVRESARSTSRSAWALAGRAWASHRPRGGEGGGLPALTPAGPFFPSGSVSTLPCS